MEKIFKLGKKSEESGYYFFFYLVNEDYFVKEE